MLELAFGLVFFVILVISIVIHELSHAVVADKLGDPTARLAGRITLNPIPHLDPIGSILLPLTLIITQSGFLIGWAKPVPFDPYNLRNPRKDSALIAVAGPLSNLAIAVIASLLIRVLSLGGGSTSIIELLLLRPLIELNVTLALFNLIPISPLDGFKIVGGLLSEEQARNWYGMERYGFVFLLILILPLFGGTSMLSVLLDPIRNVFLSVLMPGL